MYKSLLAVLIVLFICRDTHAANLQDTVVKLKSRSQAWFHSRYGKDDTSKAIIDYFFLKRRKTKTPLLVSSGISLSIGIASLLKRRSDLREPDSQIGLSLGAIVSVTIMVFFLSEYIKYSKRELIRALNHYQSGKGIPKWLQGISSWIFF
jgi:hypothetical protein